MNLITGFQAKNYIESGAYLALDEAGFFEVDGQILAFNFHHSPDHIKTVKTIKEALNFISCRI